jgi:hypothetical protein
MDPIKLFLFFYVVNFIYQTVRLNTQHDNRVILAEIREEKEKTNTTTAVVQKSPEIAQIVPQKTKMRIFYDSPVAMA